MGKGKGGKQETTQKTEVDKELVADYKKMTGIGTMLAGLGFAPNRAVTVAGLSPSQKAAMRNTNSAAGAFGLSQSSGTGLPKAEMSGSGVMGYRTDGGYDEAMGRLPEGYQAGMDKFYDAIRNFYKPPEASGSSQETPKPTLVPLDLDTGRTGKGSK